MTIVAISRVHIEQFITATTLIRVNLQVHWFAVMATDLASAVPHQDSAFVALPTGSQFMNDAKFENGD